MAVKSSERRDTRRSTSRTPRAASSARAVDTAAPGPVTIDYGPLDKYLGYYLRRLYDDYRKHFVAKADDMDVTPREVGALFVIGLNPGLTPSHLSGALSLDGAQITSMLNMFENRGLLERRVSSTDARSRLVYLTPAGRAMMKRLEKVIGEYDRDFSGGSLTDEELAQLVGLLAKLQAATNID